MKIAFHIYSINTRYQVDFSRYFLNGRKRKPNKSSNLFFLPRNKRFCENFFTVSRCMSSSAEVTVLNYIMLRYKT